MKNLVALLLIITISVPTIAGIINFTAVDNGDNTITISATGTGVRGISLLVTGITAVAGSGTSSFNVFSANNYFPGDGSPLVNANTPGVLTADSDIFGIIVGYVDMSGNQAAADATVMANVATFAFTGTGTMTITEDLLRGGVVGDNIEGTNLPITMKVIPEPITLAFLGLGGLFLRRQT